MKQAAHPAKWTLSRGLSGVSGLVRADVAISTTPVLSTASMRTLSSFRMTMWLHRFSTTPTTWRLLHLGSRDSSPTISWAWWCSPAHTCQHDQPHRIVEPSRQGAPTRYTVSSAKLVLPCRLLTTNRDCPSFGLRWATFGEYATRFIGM